ncbi:hypothetical protein AAMO2058_001724300 [Amorphochlora amoebiformis]
MLLRQHTTENTRHVFHKVSLELSRKCQIPSPHTKPAPARTLQPSLPFLPSTPPPAFLFHPPPAENCALPRYLAHSDTCRGKALVMSVEAVRRDVEAWAKACRRAGRIQKESKGEVDGIQVLKNLKSLPKSIKQILYQEIESELQSPPLTPLFIAVQDIISKTGLSRGECLWTPAKISPENSSENSEKFPTDWLEYSRIFGLPSPEDPESLPEWCVAVESLSFPMTLAYTLHNYLPLPLTTVRIDILGAEETEINGLEKWLVLAALFPSVNLWKIRFVMRMEYYRQTYHEFLVGERESPVLAAAFNSGLAEFLDDWAPTISLLTRKDIPSLFTSYHTVEAEFDVRAALALGARVLNPTKITTGGNSAKSRKLQGLEELPKTIHGAELNPFSGLLPIVDPFFPPRTYSVNGWQFVLDQAAEIQDQAL